MRDLCWFNLPDGQTARELEVTVPAKGSVKVYAETVAEIDRMRDMIHEHQDKQSWRLMGPLPDMLASVMSGYERLASEALAGAASVRDDMLAYLRSVVFVLESMTGDHCSHAEKNARMRGCIAVLERHISSLRDERFTFREGVWRRSPDLFRWDEPERRLRDRVRELEAEVKEFQDMASRAGT